MTLVLVLNGMMGTGDLLGLVLVILGPIDIDSVLQLLRQLFLTPTTFWWLAKI